MAGNRAGLDGAQSGLFYEATRIIQNYSKRGLRAVVWENVPGALQCNGGRDFARVLRALGECGALDIGWRILDAQCFGIPQRRRRLFLVADFAGERAGEVLFNQKSTGRNCPTVKEQKTEPKRDIEHSGILGGHWWNGAEISQTVDAVFHKKQCLPEKNRFPVVMVPAWTPCGDCDDYQCNPHGKHAHECHCPAIDDFCGSNLNPYDNCCLRYVTPTECERLQGFPDDWTAGQSDTTRYRQLGNAVAVPVAEWIATRLKKQL